MSKILTFLTLFVFLHSPEASAKWVWLQQQNFKQLESQNLPMDLVLFQFFESAQQALINPQVKDVYGVNFREMAFQVPDNLSQVQTATLVQKISNKISIDLVRFGKNPFAESWSEWLLKGMRWGEGANPTSAFVQMKLKSFRLSSYEQWYAKATLLRSQLQTIAAAKNIDWSIFLEASRRYGRKTDLMSEWTRSNKLSLAVGPMLSQFGFLLTMADYLDPAQFQSAQGALNQLSKTNWSNLLIIDVNGLATVNRSEQDRWLSQGANLNRLASVSQAGDEILARLQDEITKEVRENQREYVGSYSIGDSFVIALKDDAAKNRINALISRLQRIRALHYNVVSRDGRSLQETLGLNQQVLKNSCVNLLLSGAVN